MVHVTLLAIFGHSIHYNDVIMTTIAPQITSLAVVYSTVYSDADQRKHQSSASLAFVWGIHRDRWIPRTKGQLRGKCFHLMTSSCLSLSGISPGVGSANGGRLLLCNPSSHCPSPYSEIIIGKTFTTSLTNSRSRKSRNCTIVLQFLFKNAYELLNQGTLKILSLYKNHIFHCMGKYFLLHFERKLWYSAQNIEINVVYSNVKI